MQNISLYKNVYETEQLKATTVDEFLDGVRSGYWSDQIIDYGKTKDKKVKFQLPNVMISGTFVDATNKGLIAHSGFICIDVDDIDDTDGLKAALEGDSYLYAVFTSVSRNGLALILKIDGKNHERSFEAIVKYLYDEYGIVSDPSGRNVARRRFVSYDPDLYINKKAKKWTKLSKKKKPTPKFIYVENDFNDIVKRIQDSGTDITGDYLQWLNIGFGIADQFGEAGRDIYQTISQYSSKYDYAITDKQYNYCLRKNWGGPKVSIASVYYYAKLNNIETISEKTKKVARTATLNKKSKLSKEEALKNYEKFEEVDEDTQDIFNQVYDNNIDYALDDNLIEAVAEYLNSNYNIKINEVTSKIEVNGKIITKYLSNSMFLNMKLIIDKCSRELFDTVIESNFIPTYNPIREFFTSKKFEGEGLIDELFDCIISDMPKEDIRYFGKKWIVGIVSAAFGVHSPLSLVLSGRKHGTGKTEFFRRLLPNQLTPFYAESKLDSGTDDEILMTQKLLILDDEYGGKSKREATKFKEISSKQIFSLRRPYGKYNEDIERLAVLCGTTNHDDILQDATGNRRVIVFSVKGIDQDKYNSIDKEDLFLEAYNLYKSGFEWRVLGEDILRLNKSGKDFEVVNREEELFLSYYDPLEGAYPVVLTTSEIQSNIERNSGIRISTHKLGLALSKLGLEKKSIRRGSSVIKAYEVFTKEVKNYIQGENEVDEVEEIIDQEIPF